jgi:DNA-directed RNA polymerase specialized sigma subunit
MPETQQEIADRLKISRSYVSRIEKSSLKKLNDELERRNFRR